MLVAIVAVGALWYRELPPATAARSTTCMCPASDYMYVERQLTASYMGANSGGSMLKEMDLDCLIGRGAKAEEELELPRTRCLSERVSSIFRPFDVFSEVHSAIYKHSQLASRRRSLLLFATTGPIVYLDLGYSRA